MKEEGKREGGEGGRRREEGKERDGGEMEREREGGREGGREGDCDQWQSKCVQHRHALGASRALAAMVQLTCIKGRVVREGECLQLKLHNVNQSTGIG